MKLTMSSVFCAFGFFISSCIQAAPFSEVECIRTEEPLSEGKLKVGRNKDDLGLLSYTTTIYGHDQNGRHEKSIQQSPQVAVKIWGGWLAGSNRGEWGGELVFIDSNGDSEILLKDNIHDIYRVGNGVIVIAGLSHLVSSRGRIYLVTKSENAIGYRVMFGLDAVPVDSWVTESGEIYINTSYGATILRRDGTLLRVLCKGHKYSEYTDGGYGW